MQNIKRTILALSTGTLVTAAAGAVLAANPHFNFARASLQGTNLQVCFKEAGLGDSQQVTITASAMGTANYYCVNNSGNCPNAANKTTVSSEVSTSGDFTSGKNGSVSGCLLVAPPDPGTFSCPPGQTLTLGEFSYTGIQVNDEDSGATKAASPSSLSGGDNPCL